MKLSFAVLPESPAFLQPGERALNDPALGNDDELVQLATLGDFHVCPQDLVYQSGEALPAIAAVNEHVADMGQSLIIEQKHQHSTISIIDVSSCHGDGMR